ncbi:cytochrome b6-f complex iron-sulfur subunit [Peptococcaceae bacterium CEB3]|nr:cytochrome b6-f complex iron-sulfur subunit [Peptococcaceae bacterium CEB3]
MARDWTRRDVLKMGKGALVAAGLLSLYPLTRYLGSREDAVASPIISFKGELKKGAPWQNIPQTRVWLRRVSGGYQAILATCTHLGCEVRYYPEQREWRCPCHGSVYDEDGRPIRGPAPLPLPRVAVQPAGNGSLRIDTSRKLN